MTQRSQHLRWYRGTAAERGGYDTDTLIAPALWFDEDNSERPRYWDGSAWVEVGSIVSSLKLDDTGADHTLELASGEDLTADHTLTLVVDDADRTLTIEESMAAAGRDVVNTFTEVQTIDVSSTTERILDVQGTTTSTRAIDLRPTSAGIIGLSFSPRLEPASDLGTVYGQLNQYDIFGTYDVSAVIAAEYRVRAQTNFSGTIATAYALRPNFINASTSGGTITNGYAIRIPDVSSVVTGESFGIFQESPSDDNYFAGNVRIGTNSTGAQLYVGQSSTTGAEPVLLLDQADVSEEAILISYDGADVDMILMNLDVTGNPQFGWDESEDAFYYTHDLTAWRESSTQMRVAGAITWAWTTATDATRAAVGKLYAEDYGASREVIAWGANGTAATLGFYAATPVTQQAVTGARDDTEAALANLLTALDSLGLITDSTTAS